VELDRQVPAEAERLHPGVVARQHRRRRGGQAAVAVELQPGPGGDQFMVHRVDQPPADLLTGHGFDLPAERGADRLGAEADAEHGHARRIRRAQPGQLLGDPGVRIVDRALGPEHHDVIDAVEGGQRPVVGQQVHGELGAARLQGRADEPGRINAVMPDDDHAQHAGPAPPGPIHQGATIRAQPSGGAVPGVTQHPAQVHHHLGIDVLGARRVEDLGLRSDRDGELAVVVHRHRTDRLEQRRHRMPLDVVARWVLEDLAQRVPVAVVKVLWLRRRCHSCSFLA
jgi:hypothetical protein